MKVKTNFQRIKEAHLDQIAEKEKEIEDARRTKESNS